MSDEADACEAASVDRARGAGLSPRLSSSSSADRNKPRTSLQGHARFLPDAGLGSMIASILAFVCK
jgi:hypothetical protein